MMVVKILPVEISKSTATFARNLVSQNAEASHHVQALVLLLSVGEGRGDTWHT